MRPYQGGGEPRDTWPWRLGGGVGLGAWLVYDGAKVALVEVRVGRAMPPKAPAKSPVDRWLARWRRRLVIIAIILLAIVVFLVWPGWMYRWDWTGFGTSYGKPTGLLGNRVFYPDKTLWDWLQLLVVPLAVVGAAGWLNWVQADREAKRETQREQEEEKRETKREQDSVLDAYLSQMADLLLHEKLAEDVEGEKARYVARGLTLTALRRLDGERKGTVMRSLADSRLIPILDLAQADLNGAKLNVANLSDAKLGGADLNEANLNGANLSGAYLIAAGLNGAKLMWADLNGAKLSGAKLNGAKLYMADLSEADLSEADLSGAKLNRTKLFQANLFWAKLNGADLHMADVSEADLSGADLSGAHNTTPEQLDTAKSLEGATMPDGSVRP